MGNHQSHERVLSTSGETSVNLEGTNHSVLPVDDPVYPGPKLEYRIALIDAKVKKQGGFKFGLAMGQPIERERRMGMAMGMRKGMGMEVGMGMEEDQEIMSTNVKHHYKVLVNQYIDSFRLLTFFQIPSQRSGRIPFQGIFCRPSIHEPSPESWDLQIQNVQLQFSMFATGRLFSHGSTVSLPPNVQGIYDIVSVMAQKGARLICMECDGSTYKPGYRTASFGGLIYGVDVFFDVPKSITSKFYTYTAHSTPIVIAKPYGGSVQAQCDWAGVLNMYLQEGWKLVDVLIPNLESGEMGRQKQSHHMGTRTEQTIWFFEKEVSMVDDRTPKYQVTLVEYYVSADLKKIKTDVDLEGVLTEMGEKGWELCSVLDTPQTVQTGDGSGKRVIDLFFQRPLLGTIGRGSLFIQPSNIAAVAPPQQP